MILCAQACSRRLTTLGPPLARGLNTVWSSTTFKLVPRPLSNKHGFILRRVLARTDLVAADSYSGHRLLTRAMMSGYGSDDGLSPGPKAGSVWESGPAELLPLVDILENLPPMLSTASYKGDHGKIGVIGGCLEYTGAPYFAAISALKAGADLVHVFCAMSAGPVIKTMSPELIVHPYLPEKANMREKDAPTTVQAAEQVEAWFSRMDVLVIGPGLGRDPFILACVKEIMERARKADIPMVIDADGLYILNQNIELIKGYKNCILTPNGNEFGRLERTLEYMGAELPGGDSDEGLTRRIQAMSQFLEGPTIMKKGRKDLIGNKGRLKLAVSETGCPRRAGGQGDVLAGTLGVFVAWAMTGMSSNRLGALASVEGALVLSAYGAGLIVRRAQRRAFRKHRRAMLATDVIVELGAVMQEVYPVYTAEEFSE